MLLASPARPPEDVMSTHFTADMPHHSHDQKLSPLSWLAIIAGAIAMAFVIFNHLAHHGEAHGHHEY